MPTVAHVHLQKMETSQIMTTLHLLKKVAPLVSLDYGTRNGNRSHPDDQGATPRSTEKTYMKRNS